VARLWQGAAYDNAGFAKSMTGSVVYGDGSGSRRGYGALGGCRSVECRGYEEGIVLGEGCRKGWVWIFLYHVVVLVGFFNERFLGGISEFHFENVR
jgi:hypothetical protein